MKDLGKGIGTCGIWLGIGMIGWHMPTAAIMPSMMGCIATVVLWISYPSR